MSEKVDILIMNPVVRQLYPLSHRHLWNSPIVPLHGASTRKIEGMEEQSRMHTFCGELAPKEKEQRKGLG